MKGNAAIEKVRNETHALLPCRTFESAQATVWIVERD